MDIRVWTSWPEFQTVARLTRVAFEDCIPQPLSLHVHGAHCILQWTNQKRVHPILELLTGVNTLDQLKGYSVVTQSFGPDRAGKILELYVL